ncbi:hypothetical protein GG344DRAFT_83612 [Lentinula edodes]|nr:hypothetical protein GG344DRAFT_83612 [Lentinula edodes]
MFSYPDIPTDEGWEGGRFHLIEFGLYVELDGIKSVTFTGLRLHGGTPPLAPAGVLIPPSAYRWVVVLYPQAATLDGRVALNIATASNGTPVQLTPEMRDTTVYGLSMEEYVPYLFICSPHINFWFRNDDEMPEKEAEQLIASGRELNFLDDGKIIMTPQTEVDFLARAFYEHTIYHQRQILGGGILRYEDYRKGWSIKRDGITYTAGPWRLAPDTLMLPKDKNFSPRQIAQAEWHEHCKHRVEVISSAFRNYKAPIKISAPQILGKITKAARAAQKRDAISRRKGRSKKKKANATILEIINAAQKAPQVVEFNQDTSQNQPKSKPKRKSVAESKGTRRSKRIKQNLDTIHQDPTSVQRNGSSEEEGEEIQVSAEEEQEVIYELRSILSHRVCTQACCNYEYFVEWADQKTGTKEWIHEYQIDMGDMYTTYRHNAFTQVLDDLSPGPMDKEVEYPDKGHDELPIAEKNRSDSISFQSEHVADIAPFLMKVSRESLVSTICLLKEGIASKQAMEGSSIQDLFQKINRFHAALDHSPLDTRMMKAAVDVWPSITLLLTNSKVYDSSARIIHHTIMLTHYRLYTWVAESIEHVLDHPSSHWWYRVIKVVREVVERGIPGTFQFNSLEFLPTIQPPKTYTWIFQKRQHDQHTANILLASRIIFHWLGLPIESDDKHSAQSLFLRNLMDSCHTATVLLLNEVWDAYTMPSQLCSVHSKRAFPSKSAMKKLGQIFRDHPILGCNCSSEIQQLIDALQSAHCQFVGLPMSYHGPSPSVFM